jgi:hypothetical protein
MNRQSAHLPQYAAPRVRCTAFVRGRGEPDNRAIFLQSADEVPSVIPEALEEFFRGIPRVKQDKLGFALEPIARIAQEFEGQVVLGDPAFVPHAEGERHTVLTVGPDEQDYRHPEKHLTVLVRPDPGSLPQQTCRRFRHDRVIHDEITPSYSEQDA